MIIVTADGEEGRERAIGMGADEYFTKPFSPITLLQTVERVLSAPPTGRVIEKVEPLPGVGRSGDRRRPCAPTISRVTASPSPEPSAVRAPSCVR